MNVNDQNDVASKYVLLDYDKCKKYKNGDKYFNGYKYVYVDLIKDLILNDSYYEKLSKFINKSFSGFKVYYISKNDPKEILLMDTIGKMEIIDALKDDETLDKISKERIEDLKKKASFDYFYNENLNKNYEIVIDGENIVFPVKDIIDCLLNDDLFEKLVNDEKNIFNMEKERFVYIVDEYFESNNIFKNYNIPSKVKKRFDYLEDNFDISAINMITETSDNFVSKVTLNEEFKENILGDMPLDLEDVQKAIYIYIKLCKTLVYDEEFFVLEQREEAYKKHDQIQNISNITLENNKVVCYEFNLIYGKFLNEIGINFETRGLGTGFADGHAFLLFRSGKFIASADSTTSVLNGDLLRAKLDEPLKGLHCVNWFESTRKEFDDHVNKIYQLLSASEIKEESFEDILADYQDISDDKKISLNTKINIMMDKARNLNLTSFEQMAYFVKLKSILFEKDEIDVTIIRNNEGNVATIVFVFNNLGSRSYFIGTGNELIPISKEELEEKMFDGSFAYIEPRTKDILGIRNVKGRRK